MNKRYLIFIIFLTVIAIISSSVRFVSAASPSPTTVIDKLKQIEILKEKIATKVAQLRESEKGAISGIIKSKKDKSIVVSKNAKDQTVTYSDDTIFFKLTGTSKNDPQDAKFASTLKEKDSIAAIGYFDSEHSAFSAKYIYFYVPQMHRVGKIVDIDKENYTISVKEPQGDTLVDIEKYTKIYSFNKNNSLEKSGFSKLRLNDTVHIFDTENPKEENRVSATKIISFTFNPPVTPATADEKEASPTAKPKN